MEYHSINQQQINWYILYTLWHSILFCFYTNTKGHFPEMQSL
jgi:hypothetical protein